MKYLSESECLELFTTAGYPLEAGEVILFAANEIVRYMADFYELEGPPPKVNFYRSQDVHAKAHETEGILIGSGVIELSLFTENKFACVNPRIQNSDGTLILGDIPMVVLAWVAAHEFVHFARGHFELSRTTWIQQKIYEHDADNLAIAAVYDFFRCRIKLMSVDCLSDLKPTIIASIFWVVRDQFGKHQTATESGDYPSWYTRLYFCALKLAMKGIVTPESVKKGNWAHDPKLLEEEKILLAELIRCDRNYIRAISMFSGSWKRDSKTDSNFIEFLEKIMKGESEEIEEIQTLRSLAESHFDDKGRLRILARLTKLN